VVQAKDEKQMSVNEQSARAGSPEAMAPGEGIAPVYIINTCFGLAEAAPSDPIVKAAGVKSGNDRRLSVRAINVLKILAVEITAGVPPRDDWVPPESLLRKITVERLSIARNCGPRTVDEIIRWAEARGVKIQPVFHAGKSLSETWRDLAARSSAGELTRAELAEALEKSVRRKSTKIPVSAQKILLKFLNELGSGSRPS
jgi:hypothetical protein